MMNENFQKAIEDLTREEAQAELRRAWDMWREMDDLHDQACDWAIAANSLRVVAVTALEAAQKTLGAIREAAALAPSLPASTILDILGESE